MRIVQIIDSLEAGGAEKMAVNYANALSKNLEFSGLIASRKEGLLLNQIDSTVSFLFLNKTKKVDFKAVFRLRKYLKRNKVNIIHAHSSSFFISILLKITLPQIKILWHDHYGISQDLRSRKNLSLKIGSLFFTGIISVNSALKDWAKSYLWCSNIIYLPNFIIDSSIVKEDIFLNGLEGKRIICVANLLQQKNHKLLIDAANLLKHEFPDWTFHLFGKDFEDSYSDKLKKKIAVLPSLSEGLPLAVLEYGLYRLPVVVTNVGEISKIITSEKEGLVVESNNIQQFVGALKKLIVDQKLRDEAGLALHNNVQLNFSETIIIRTYLLWLKSLTTFTL